MIDLTDIVKQINAELDDINVELSESSVLRFESKLIAVARKLFTDAEHIIDLYFEIRDDELEDDVDTIIENNWSSNKIKSTLIEYFIRAVDELGSYSV